MLRRVLPIYIVLIFSVLLNIGCSVTPKDDGKINFDNAIQDLEHPNKYRRAMAWIVLGSSYDGEKKVIKMIPLALDDPSSEVRWGALSAIRQSIKGDALPYIDKIERLSRNDEDEKVREIAAEVLLLLKELDEE